MVEADAVRNKMHYQDNPRHDDHEDASVYLRVTWVFAALRCPQWRLVTCSLRILCFVLACATSPLLASLQSPGHFPVYSAFLGVLSTHLSPWKLLVHGILTGMIALWIRFVVYPLWFQDQWNWRRQYRRARHTFRRLSRVASAREMKEMMQQQQHQSCNPQQRRQHQQETTSEAIQLRIFHSTTRDTASCRVRVHTEPRAQGSWTLMVALLPVSWWAVVRLLRCIVHDTDYDALFFGQDTGNPQWRVQLSVFQTVMTLSTMCWLLSLDEMVQDLAPRTNTTLRIAVNWLLLLLLGAGGVYCGGFSQLFAFVLTTWSQQASHPPWLTSASWRCMVSGFVVVLDLLWLVQDRQFPTFATQVGTKIYGLHRDFVAIPTRFQGIGSIFITSKWIHTSLVAALLLPLDLCAFFQDYTYNPQDYSQVVGIPSDYRVFPSPPYINATVDIPHEIEALLTNGSIGRYYLQSSALDRVPSLVCVVMMAGLFVWLQNREQWKLCYAAFLGEPTRADQAKATHDINTALAQPVRVVLKDQLRLHNLYRVRSQLDLLGAWLAVVSVGIVVLQVRSIWRSETSSNAIQEKAGETYGALLAFVSLLMVYQLYHRYAIKYEMLVLRKQIPRTNSKRWWQGASKSLLLYPFLLEVLVSASCLPPFAHGELRFDEERFLVLSNQIANTKSCPSRMVSTSAQSCALQYAYPLEALNLVVFARLYWLLRLLRNALFDKLVSDHGALLATACSSFSANSSSMLPRDISSLRWSLRMCVALMPGRVIAGLFVVLWVGTSAAVSILERPFPSRLDDEVHSLWLTIVTISSVGYGDAYPVTAFGRLAIILGAVLGGAVVVSLMTSIFLETLKGSTEEHHFVQQLELLTHKKQLQQKSASLIAAVWTAHQRRKRQTAAQDQDQTDHTHDDHHHKDQANVVLQRAHAFKIARKFNGPKETLESLEQSQIRSIAQWRATSMRELVALSSRQRREAVASLEHEVAALEISLAALLAR